ncbi:hypothetical protein AR1Y2_3392 [Anaerostipes rhamnosivorans]|uniref:Uncharacterized protein n=1 Tax=Anaerostipes rhamnosivorans TaxID=1229621 RepID=A0A4P8IHC9_9FIRM|nr:hypothetical protein AR1Y2_3392 [Anaerostipes rhamnosivorans]
MNILKICCAVCAGRNGIHAGKVILASMKSILRNKICEKVK